MKGTFHYPSMKRAFHGTLQRKAFPTVASDHTLASGNETLRIQVADAIYVSKAPSVNPVTSFVAVTPASVTNEILRAQALDNASWVKVGDAAIVANQATDSDGVATLDELTCSTGIANRVQQAFSAKTGQWTFSFEVREGDSTKVHLHIFEGSGTDAWAEFEFSTKTFTDTSGVEDEVGYQQIEADLWRLHITATSSASGFTVAYASGSIGARTGTVNNIGKVQLNSGALAAYVATTTVPAPNNEYIEFGLPALTDIWDASIGTVSAVTYTDVVSAQSYGSGAKYIGASVGATASAAQVRVPMPTTTGKRVLSCDKRIRIETGDGTVVAATDSRIYYPGIAYQISTTDSYLAVVAADTEEVAHFSISGTIA